jgi:hypothetical protein
MDNKKHVIHVGNMRVRNRKDRVALVQTDDAPHRVQPQNAMSFSERLLRDCALCTALMLCVLGMKNVDQPVAAMTAQRLSEVVTTDFESDEILGRLQFVHALLPESVQVFWNTAPASESMPISAPSEAELVHAWASGEPWMEYAGGQAVFACETGEVMSVTRMDDGTYSLRIRHENELESLYGQLSECLVQEGSVIARGERLGSTEKPLLFEVRREGGWIDPAELMAAP